MGSKAAGVMMTKLKGPAWADMDIEAVQVQGISGDCSPKKVKVGKVLPKRVDGLKKRRSLSGARPAAASRTWRLA